MSEDNNDGEINYNRSLTTVQHRNIDASGDDHVLGDEPLDWEVESMRALIKNISEDLYSSWEATVREYIANAETACLRVQEYIEEGDSDFFDGDLIVDEPYEPRIDITWDRQNNKFTIEDNGIGMSKFTLTEVFRKVGNSGNADTGNYSGEFGQGVLSFYQIEGEDSMLMVTHSRQTDENYAANISVAGAEPIMGERGADEYGTRFEMTPKNPDWNLRRAVEKYAEYSRVTIRYEEINENGEEAFNEDYGGKTLYDEYDKHEVMADVSVDGAFDAIASPNASNKTLLLSMPINRGGSIELSKLDTNVDVQLHDESGKVFSGPNEGKIPIARSEYEAMLLERTEGIVTDSTLDSMDVVAQDIIAGPNEGKTALSNQTFDERFPDASTETYVPKRGLTGDDVPGEATVIEGPNEGCTVVGEDEWEERTADMLPNFVPEDELTDEDMTLPVPKSDRDSLQYHDEFWNYIESEIDSQVQEIVDTLREFVEESDNSQERLRELDEEKVRELAP